MFEISLVSTMNVLSANTSGSHVRMNPSQFCNKTHSKPSQRRWSDIRIAVMLFPVAVESDASTKIRLCLCLGTTKSGILTLVLQLSSLFQGGMYRALSG